MSRQHIRENALRLNTEEREIHRLLLLDNMGDERLALEHAVRTICILGHSAGFGFGRWSPYKTLDFPPKKPLSDPVLIDGEPK